MIFTVSPVIVHTGQVLTVFHVWHRVSLMCYVILTKTSEEDIIIPHFGYEEPRV